jgi:hypothetical protein
VIAGPNFEPGFSPVIISPAANGELATAVDSGTSEPISGSVTVLSGAAAGKWNVIVRTADGANVAKANAVTVL